jgi:hypothetical protein
MVNGTLYSLLLQHQTKSCTLRELAASARDAVSDGQCVRVQSNSIDEAISRMDALIALGGVKEC